MTHKILRASPRLKDLGPVSASWLAGVGVKTRADLIRLGPVQAFLRVRDAGHKASMNLLWALAGAERGLRWNKLPEDDRQRLLIELDAAVAARDAPAAPVAPAGHGAAARPRPAPKPVVAPRSIAVRAPEQVIRALEARQAQHLRKTAKAKKVK
jgi:DNA transformation protein